MHLAALDEAAADKGVDRHMHEVAIPRSDALCQFGQGRGGRVVLDKDGCLRIDVEEFLQFDGGPASADVFRKAELVTPVAEKVG
jgi:hypothetical protein